MFVMFDAAKVAISDGPFGTLSGVQLTAVFQSPLAGELSHCALPATAGAPQAIVIPAANAKTVNRHLKNLGFAMLPRFLPILRSPTKAFPRGMNRNQRLR